MPQNPNDALWDPRPRLGRESEHVGAESRVPPDRGSVLVELSGGAGMTPVAALEVARGLKAPGFTLDEEFGAVAFGRLEEQTFVVRGDVSDDRIIAELEHDPRVIKVWRDTPVAPF